MSPGDRWKPMPAKIARKARMVIGLVMVSTKVEA
jgi:hypothetical protein